MEIRKITSLVLTVFFIQASWGQIRKMGAGAIPVFTSDSLTSGSTKNILTSFFQTAFNNLTGQNKEFNFTSNPFAVMLKSNPSLAEDENYYKYRMLRKLNIGFGLKLDTSYRFNGFSSGIKYALINERDSTTSMMLFSKLLADSVGRERDTLTLALRDYAQAAVTDPESKKQFNNNLNLLFNGDTPFSKLEKSFQDIVKQIAQKRKLILLLKMFSVSPNTVLKTVNREIYQLLKSSIKNNLLWTIGISDTTYKDQFLLSNLVIGSELSKGIFKLKPGSNLELHFKTDCNFLKDTLQAGKNLKRIIFNFEPGINWVIRNKRNDISNFEFKFRGKYTHNFSSLYLGNKRDQFTLNGNMNVRIYADIWIPFEFTYDPSNGNVLGFLSVKANFTGLGKLLTANTQ